MIAQGCGFGMWVGRFSRPRREVGVIAMPDVGLDTTRCVESVCDIPLGAGVLRQLVPAVVVRVSIDRCCVARGMICATRQLFSEDEGVEF